MWGHKGCSITHNGPTLLLPKVIYNEQALFQANLLCWYNSPHIIAHTHNYTYFHLNQNFPLNTMQTSTRFKIQSSRTHARAILGDSLSYVRVCLCVCMYAYILSPVKFASSVNSNLNHVYQSIISLDLRATSWTRMETTHGPTSSNDNSDGSYCMTTKTTSNWKCSEDAESAFAPSCCSKYPLTQASHFPLLFSSTKALLPQLPHLYH